MKQDKKKNISLGFFTVALLLSILDLEFLRAELRKFYAEDWRWRKFDSISMLKLDIFRVIKMKNFPEIIKYLKQYPQEAKLLGFIELPSDRTLWHWEKMRVGGNGFRILFKICVRKLKFLLVPFKIVLGKHVGQDSTPIKSTRNDSSAAYNPHYGMKMHKCHITLDVDLGITLNYLSTGGVEYDGKHLLPLLNEIIANLETTPENCTADGSYGSFENHAHLNMKGIELLVNPAVDDIYHPEADEKGLWQEYQKLRDERGWFPPDCINLRQTLEFLYSHGKIELVGKYFRNKILQIKDTVDFLKKYHRRSLDEGINGVLKDNSEFGRMRVNGSSNCLLHCGVHLLAFLAVGPLFKVQQGVPTGLMSLSHVIV